MSAPTAAEERLAPVPAEGRPSAKLWDKASQLVGLFVFLAIWEGSLRIFDVPQFILPTPIEIVKRIAEDAWSGLIFVHLQITLVETLFGFFLAAILGIGLGCAVGLMPRFERIVYPYILALQTVPKVAVAPLMIIWVGYGIQSKISHGGPHRLLSDPRQRRGGPEDRGTAHAVADAGTEGRTYPNLHEGTIAEHVALLVCGA